MPFIASQSGRTIQQPISARPSLTQCCLFFRLPQELRDEIHVAVLMNDNKYHPKPGMISVLPQNDTFGKKSRNWDPATFRVMISESEFGWLASCRDNHYEVSKLYFRYKRFYFADTNVFADFMIHSSGSFRLRQKIQHLDLELKLDGGMTKMVAKIINKMPSLKTLTIRFDEDPELIPMLMDMDYLRERFGRLCDVRGLQSLHFDDAFRVYTVAIPTWIPRNRVWYWWAASLVSDGDLLGTLIRERVCLPRGGRIARSNEVGEGASYWYDIPSRLCAQAQQAVAHAIVEGIEQPPGPSAPHPSLRFWTSPL